MATFAPVHSASSSTHRLTGCIGILGALLLFAGDMLLLGHFGSATDFRAGMLETIRSAPPARLLAGGLLGPVAGALLVAGFWQVCQRVQEPKGRAARAMLGLFVLFAVGMAAIHSVWAVFELVIQSCGSADSTATAACQALAASVQGYMRLSLLALAVPGAIASVILAVLVLRGRTHLPRWTVLANPLLLVAVLLPAFAAAPAPIGAVLLGGSASILLLVFFAVAQGSIWGRVQ
ncbi:DUF6796 family protein [Acidovorax sp. A1169]|uniref:DUF6796 family protein n=1 Tax=Acidovorax sp. A1169 TaxID=3059524 RepID=UPI002737C571|nr:DUF6796 family protein [Acidovorax sp. A1169]MDP4078303.1 hypothetical protein [Acidovorax sp. A1169]